MAAWIVFATAILMLLVPALAAVLIASPDAYLLFDDTVLDKSSGHRSTEKGFSPEPMGLHKLSVA